MVNNTLIINGVFWGDEGKGKMTDFFAAKADVVVRSQGGSNAGHTIVLNNKNYSLRLLPSGIYNKDILNVLSNGVVIDLEFLAKEIEMVQKEIKHINLLISGKAHLVMPYHKELDSLWEAQRENKIGTTKNGIGPAYADKMLRFGIRLMDLEHREIFRKKLEENTKIVNTLFKAFKYDYKFSFEKEFDKYINLYDKIKKYVGDTSELLNEKINKKEKILFEGAQGTMLCIDHGTYPMVTSSSPTALSVALNSGISSRHLTNCVGITKAYTTRVGEGPFVSEFEDEIAQQIREVGHEYGTVTSRKRRIGWLDLVVLNYSIKLNGINNLSIMLLDVLSNIKKIKICTHYELNGQKIDHLPTDINQLANAKPVYLEMDGWSEDITKITSYNLLPENAKQYIKKIEELTKIDIATISVGPDRKQTIIRKDIF